MVVGKGFFINNVVDAGIGIDFVKAYQLVEEAHFVWSCHKRRFDNEKWDLAEHSLFVVIICLLLS